MDLLYHSSLPPGDGVLDSEGEITDADIFRDSTTFSIIFSPSGKLVIHDVRIRNRDGAPKWPSTADSSLDDIFNAITRITDPVNPTGMFIQDNDTLPTPGLSQESSRNHFIIYETKKFKQAYNNGNAWNYLYPLSQKPAYINPYTGTIIGE